MAARATGYLLSENTVLQQDRLLALKTAILQNTFAVNVRTRMWFDDNEYQTLIRDLTALSQQWQTVTEIDKELALCLYSLPQSIRNLCAGFTQKPLPDIALRLEDAWLELDALVLACLSGTDAA